MSRGECVKHGVGFSGNLVKDHVNDGERFGGYLGVVDFDHHMGKFYRVCFWNSFSRSIIIDGLIL